MSSVPPSPDPPSARGPSSGKATPSIGRSCLVTSALLVAYLLASALLLVLPTGFIGPVFAFGGLFFVFVIGVHYLLWGRWLSKVLAEDKQERDDG